MKILSYLLVYRRLLLIVLTPLLLLPLPLIIKTKEAECAYTLFVVAIFWLTEALPLAVSALLPAIMFPFFGIMGSKQVASAYFKDFHLLLIGVICLATSTEKWNLHKRVALRMVMLVGVNPAWLMLGFMVSCAFLSMWLSNTSAAAMVMPIVEAVAQQIIRAEAEADALEMSCSNGSVNPALELDENIGECENTEWKEKQINGYNNNVASTVCTVEEENEKGKEQVSNLSEWVASKLTPIGSLPLWLIILISCLIVTLVTEVASNAATITIFLPILSPLAEAIHVNPLFILIPATLCTSFAFLLPVSNPSNAIVFSYRHLTVMDMVKAGLGINIIGVAVVMLAIMTWIVPIFDLYTYPSWIPNIPSTNGTGL
ncbi:hypothetical protein BTVI_70283 [Pitangus sulphuratus]|nr:hypothetical protein BTVI_70283 [Pitangus sulphuratus]